LKAAAAELPVDRTAAKSARSTDPKEVGEEPIPPAVVLRDGKEPPPAGNNGRQTPQSVIVRIPSRTAKSTLRSVRSEDPLRLVERVRIWREYNRKHPKNPMLGYHLTPQSVAKTHEWLDIDRRKQKIREEQAAYRAQQERWARARSEQARKIMEQRLQEAVDRSNGELRDLSSEQHRLSREILEEHEKTWPPDMRRGGGPVSLKIESRTKNPLLISLGRNNEIPKLDIQRTRRKRKFQ
jgi:hypothetical protein